jgi:hypothetical protein
MQEHEGPILTYQSRIRNRELEAAGRMFAGCAQARLALQVALGMVRMS